VGKSLALAMKFEEMRMGTARLDRADLEFYNAEGYLLYRKPVLPQGKFEGLKAHFEEKLERLPADVRPEAMDVPHFVDTKLFEWLLADEILDLVEPIIGPDIGLWSSHFICKPKGNGKRVPWHEDSFYWKGRLDPMRVLTVWLAIDPSTEENGCMRVIPRTQHNGFSEYEPVDETKNVFGSEIRKFQVDESRAVACVLEPNECSLHDGKMIHGSEANTSSKRRCGYTMRYFPTSAKLSEEQYQWHNVYLARGRDLAGNRYADPSKSYEQLARYREVSKKKDH
jgi:chlorinating enzyme